MGSSLRLALRVAFLCASLHVACVPPQQSGQAGTPGSCQAAIISAGFDGYNGRGTTSQTQMYQQMCHRDRQIQELNRQHELEVARLQEMERERAALEQREARLAQQEAELRAARASAVTQGVQPAATVATPPQLLLFGGRDHKTFLGCFCGETSSDSVLNRYGKYGNEYSTDTIWNDYGEFGSSYSSTSVCNPYALDPPVVVTDTGNFIGYLTLNRYKGGAITLPDVLAWLETSVCGDD